MRTKQEEVSLLDLWYMLAAEKKVFMLTWVLCVMMGVGYVFFATPVYKAETFMLPPSEQDVQLLNLQLWPMLNDTVNSKANPSVKVNENMLLGYYTPEQVYTVFLQSLRSRAERRKFYDKYKVAKSLDVNDSSDPEAVFEEVFSQNLIVQQNTRKKELNGFSSLAYEGEDPELAALWVNSFVKEVSQSVAQRLVGDVMSQVEGLKQSIKDQIEGKKTLARVRRQDRIVALEEAMKITAAAGKTGDDTVLMSLEGVVINADNVPLYMLPLEILKAEVKVLKERKDDTPFIVGLRDLEEKVAILDQIHIQPEDVRVMVWDQRASILSESEKPNKGLIISISLLLGFLAGLLLVFLKLGLLRVSGQLKV